MAPMIRSAFLMLVSLGWTFLLQFPVTASVLLTGSGNAAAWMARRFWAPVILWAAGVTVVADPYPALDPAQPYIFMSNHQGYLDIPVAYRTIQHSLRFVAKRSLRYVPALGWYLWMAGHVLIDRRRGREAKKSLDLAAMKIAAGTSILVYPEGARTSDGTIQSFRSGPFTLALAAQVPIVPVAVEGSFAVLPRGRWTLRPQPIRIRLGTPIATAGLTMADRGRLMQLVRGQLIEANRTIGGPGGSIL